MVIFVKATNQKTYMAQNTPDNIEEKIRTDSTLSDEHKTELIDLVSNLKSEAMKEDKDPSMVKSALSALRDAVKKFEVSHPVLVEDINYAASVLANMGI